jgi:hypothetical protein
VREKLIERQVKYQMISNADRLTKIIESEKLSNILELRKYVRNNSEVLGMTTKQMNSIISENVEYFALWFDAVYQEKEKREQSRI